MRGRREGGRREGEGERKGGRVFVKNDVKLKNGIFYVFFDRF